jgi:hypothetical protein
VIQRTNGKRAAGGAEEGSAKKKSRSEEAAPEAPAATASSSSSSSASTPAGAAEDVHGQVPVAPPEGDGFFWDSRIMKYKLGNHAHDLIALEVDLEADRADLSEDAGVVAHQISVAKRALHDVAGGYGAFFQLDFPADARGFRLVAQFAADPAHGRWFRSPGASAGGAVVHKLTSEDAPYKWRGKAETAAALKLVKPRSRGGARR